MSARFSPRLRSWGFAMALVVAVGGLARAGDAVVFDFEDAEVGKPAPGFVAARTGPGRDGVWVVKVDPSAPSPKQVLAQTDNDPTDKRYALCLEEKTKATDVTVSVRFKPVSGKVDQAGGLVLRYQTANDYYLVRANALEDNVRLYHVKGGTRTQLKSESAKVTAGQWHHLAFTARGKKLEASFDGKKMFEAEDATFTAAGKVGVWTKSDSVTHFDDLSVEVLDAAMPGAEPKAPPPEGAPKQPAKPSAKAVAGPVEGLMVRDDDEQPGAVIDWIADGSPASQAGLTFGDAIIAVDGAPVNSVGTLKKRFEDAKSGDLVPITVLRGGAERFLKVRAR